MALVFHKYEGLGNDFVIVDGRKQEADLALAVKHAVRLCDRHLGVGADGVLLLSTRNGRPFMRVVNADGSRPEMCGNGIRTVALHLVRTGLAGLTALPGLADKAFEVDTDAGPHLCKVSDVSSHGRQAQVQVSMRAPVLEPKSVPVLGDRPVLDEMFEAGGSQLHMTCVSMGNPHAVTFDEIGEARATLGPLLEKHARFPHAANIGFARVIAPQLIELAVWERGVGFTQACGTGACACAVAAVETGRAQRKESIEVRLPGGPLQIVVGAPGERLLMTGPARHVFDGSIELS